MACLALVLTVIAGVLTWQPRYGNQEPSIVNEVPFYYAMENLYTAPMVDYSSASADAGTSWKITVTSGGEELGTFTSDGQQSSVMLVGGITFVKPPDSMLPLLPTNLPITALEGQWIAGDSDLTDQLPDSLLTPGQLAKQLWSGLAKANDFPLFGAATVPIDGRPALDATTSDGTVYVSASAPYQLLRLVPISAAGGTPGTTPTSPPSGQDSATPSSGSAAALNLAPGPVNARSPNAEDAAFRGQPKTDAGSTTLADLGQTDFTPESPSTADQTYGTLVSQTKTLATAPDIGVDTSYNHSGNLNCSKSDCVVTENITTTTTSDQAAELSGSITAILTATVTADGQAGGGCTQSQSLPINGSGTITCEDTGVAPAVRQIENQEQNEANEEGQDISYTIDFEATVQIETIADVQAEIDQQIQAEQTEQNTADQTAQATADCDQGKNCKAIALGLQETDENAFALADFADSTNSDMYTDWPGGPDNWVANFKTYLSPASSVQINVNLDGITDPVASANDAAGQSSPSDGNYTNWELAMIRDAPSSVRSRISWYLNGVKQEKGPFGW